MIVVKLQGGLGNQMFQYAAARQLAYIHGTTLKLDLSFLNGPQVGHTIRKYNLDCFEINAEKASKWDIMGATNGSGNIIAGAALLLLRCTGLVPFYFFFRENAFNFNSELLELPENSYIEGYWQSEKYFKDIEGIIRNEYKFKKCLSLKYLELANSIDVENSVSLHIRRGDYVTHHATGEFHGICGIDYYQKAMNLISKNVESPHYFVFSDDPDWAVCNISSDKPITFVSCSQSSAEDDLRLMSRCRHHVIANSSFSWWGAWLSDFRDKIVIAPKLWFKDQTIDTSDLIPNGWIRL